MKVENPLSKIKLETWPDFMLAIFGTLLLASSTAMISGNNNLATRLSILFGGFVLFGIGGKIAHYKFRDPSIAGNANVWFSGWRHSLLGNSFAGIGIFLVLAGICLMLRPIYMPCIH